MMRSRDRRPRGSSARLTAADPGERRWVVHEQARELERRRLGALDLDEHARAVVLHPAARGRGAWRAGRRTAGSRRPAPCRCTRIRWRTAAAATRSADPRERVADEHVDDPGAAEGREEHDDALGIGVDLADGRAPRPTGWPAGRRARRRPRRAATTATSLPSLATYSGSMPSRSQARVHGGVDGQPGLVEHDREVRGLRQLVADRAEPAAGRVAQPAGARRRRRAAPRPARRAAAVSERMSASSARSPRASITAMPWSAIVPETSTTSPGRTSSGAERRGRQG